MTQTLPLAGPVRWSLDHLFMVRIAGLPFELLDELHGAASAAWADVALSREAHLHDRSAAVADALTEAVAARVDDVALRRQLIQLRRDAFNHRGDRDRRVTEELADRLGGETADLVRGWLRAWDDYTAEYSRGAAVVEADLGRQRRVLRRAATDPVLRKGLLLASPVLDRQLPTYLEAGDGPLGKRARRIERSLGEYLLRTVAKTSPFSTLTSVALGTFQPNGGDLLQLDLESSAQSFTRLNMAVLARLVAVVMEAPDLLADLPVRLTTGWRVDGGRVRYLRRSQSTAVTDEESAFTLDFLHENLFYLPDSGLVTEVIEVMQTHPQLRLAELTELLVARCQDDPGEVGVADDTRDELRRYVGLLLRLGLLVLPSLRVDINAADPLGAFRAQLAQTGLPWAVRLADRLDSVGQAVHAYRAASVDERRVLFGAIRGELQDAHLELSSATVPPRTLLYEDTALAARASASSDRWARQILPDLQDVASLLPVFDVNLPRRITTKGYFQARYGRGGRCDDFIGFAHEFHQDFFMKYAERQGGRPTFAGNHAHVPSENWFHQSELPALDQARAAVAEQVAHGLRRLPPGAEELSLDRQAVKELAASVPRNLGDVSSWSFLLQLAAADVPTAVINRCYNGLTQQFSRFAHCVADVAAPVAPDLRGMLADVQPPGAVFAELKGGYEATNLNLHPAVTPYELVCQGELSFRPPEERLAVEDLFIAHDEDADQLRLYSRRLDREVIPVYLGFLVPTLLPEVQQVLFSFGGAGMAHLDLWAGVSDAHPDRPVVALPRISYGNVVLQRRMWRARRDALPERPATDPAGSFLAWSRWRHEHGLPRRVFAAGVSMPGWRSRTKPSFVDFEQHLSLSLLSDLARESDGIVLTEMLPGPDELCLRDARGSYVSELVVQLTGTRVAEA